MEAEDLMKPMVERARGVPPKGVVFPVVVLVLGVLLLLFLISIQDDEPPQRGDDVAKRSETNLSESDRLQMNGAQKMVSESYASSGLTPELMLSAQIHASNLLAESNVKAVNNNPNLEPLSPATLGVHAPSYSLPLAPPGSNTPKGGLLGQTQRDASLSNEKAALWSPLTTQSKTPLPVGLPQWGEDGAVVKTKNDALALRAAREVEVLNSKMVVADYDDRAASFAATAPALQASPSNPSGLTLGQEQSQTLNSFKRKLQDLSISSPFGAAGTSTLSKTQNAQVRASNALDQALTGGQEIKPLGSSASQPSELIASLSNALGENGLGTSAVSQHPSLASKDALFLKELNSPDGTTRGLRPRRLESERAIFEGSVIPAVLARDIVSDLPGSLTALVSEDVYDSLTSTSVLICKGAKLVGRYNHDVRVGQSRLMFAFTRLILNTGESFDLSGFEGSDALGRAGYEGDVNNHFLKIYGSSLAIGTLADQVSKQSQVPQGTFAQPSATGQIMVQTTREILTKARDVSPTITIEHGTAINVEVKRDLIFPNAKKAGCT